MLNLEEINNTIEELENGTTTFDTCNKLASLYIVRQNLQINNIKPQNDVVETELQDILPQYKIYCKVKRKYQLKELTDQAVYEALTNVCKEIQEFIQTLYSSTDTPKERSMIKQLLYTLNGTL